MAYDPTQADVAVVRALLQRAGMVADLIDDILDYAEYWLRATSRAELNVSIPAHLAPGLSEEFHGNRFLLRSWPVGLTRADFFPRADWSTLEEPNGDNPSLLELLEREYQTRPTVPCPVSSPCDRAFFRTSWPRPLPRLDHPVKKLVFRLTTRDQGWTTHSTKGAFHDACTWFDVGIERFDRDLTHLDIEGRLFDAQQLRPVEPPPVQDPESMEFRYALRERFNEWEIQRGRVAQGAWEEYEVTWRPGDDVREGSGAAEALFREGKNPRAYDGRFVGGLRVGDVVTVWGRSVQAGWVNHVKAVQIDVYWAV